MEQIVYGILIVISVAVGVWVILWLMERTTKKPPGQ